MGKGADIYTRRMTSCGDACSDGGRANKVGTSVVVTVCDLVSCRPLVVCYDLGYCCHHACYVVALRFQCDCYDYDLDDAESLMMMMMMMMMMFMCMDGEEQRTPRLCIPHVPFEGGHGCSRIWVCRCQQESGDPNRRSKSC